MVTGAGSGVGQGIIKALNISSLECEIVSADISPLNAALYRTKSAIIFPKVESSNAINEIIKIINTNQINIVLIGSEFDLQFFSINKNLIERQTGALVVASPQATVEISNDKWKTVKFLKENSLPFPESEIPESLEQAFDIAKTWHYPFIIKPREGTSSRGVFIIENEEDLLTSFDKINKPIMQRIIRMPEDKLHHEYTCSVFKCADGALLGPFAARRTLRSGSSWLVEVNEFNELKPLLMEIGSKLPFMGSLNVQLMMSESGPIPFEFNARFSGTTAIRAHFGFNEPEMVIRNYFFGAKLETPLITKGMAIRYLEEVFVDNYSAEAAEKYFGKGEVHKWF
ncbi:MAG TPA: ATP-grasp domain-containing protein [Desulfuromonadaceae bacterium]|jgi:carbamoyl-phosphate synthase large subunit